jgi:hypothetical protein
MDTVVETQAIPESAVQEPAAGKNSFFRRLSKWALYLILALALGAVTAFGYSEHWFKGSGNKAKNALGAVPQGPVAGASAIASPADTLSQARQAFAAGDLQGAIKAYQALLANNPQDINAMGELGNVFYAAGWIPQATQTYFVTANKAMDQNRPELARAMIPAIETSNPILASRLHERLFEMESRRTEAQMQAQMREGPPQPAQSEGFPRAQPQGPAIVQRQS